MSFTYSVDLVNRETSEKLDTRKIFPVARDMGWHDWSPDSKTIAWFDRTKSAIFLLSIDTLTNSHLVDVKRNSKNQYDYFNGRLLWLPDGKQIIFVQTGENGGYEVCITDLSGNSRTLFTTHNPGLLFLEPTRY